MDDDERNEPDFLDIMDMWDEPLEPDEDEDEEPFVPMYSKPWFRYLAVIVAASMIGLAAYSGLRAIFNW